MIVSRRRKLMSGNERGSWRAYDEGSERRVE